MSMDKYTRQTTEEKLETRMQLDKTIKQKRLLGALRKANKTKPRSPDLTGQMKLQRHTAAAIVDQFSHEDIEGGRLQHRGMEKSRLQRSISQR
jgi:hypothetical protein